MASYDILDNFTEGFCRWTPDWRLLKANAAFFRLTDIRGESSFSELHGIDKLSFTFYELGNAIARQVENLESINNFEIRLARETGGYCWFSVNARRVPDARGQTGYYDAYIRDITETKSKEAELSHQTFYDRLTGLANRELFVDRIRTALQTSKRRKDIGYAVLSFDLRHFKNINQHYGRGFGNMLLRHTAETIRACCREADAVARTGSDEFGVLLQGLEDGAQIVKIIKRVRSRLNAPFSAWEQSINSVRLDIGVIFPLTDYGKPESVLRDLDIAVGKAKGTRSKLGCKFFSRRQLEETRKHLSLSVVLQEKHNLEDFYLDYQPIVRPVDGGIHSFETLVRWKHEGAVVPPSIFIPIAEETGFIGRLGDFVIEESCRQMRYWQEKHAADIRLHVNISPYQLAMPTFPETVLAALSRTGVDASRLFFEVTESAFLRDFKKVLYNINAVRKQGIQFCLDDFGTGYSSLSHLRHLPIKCLKIDRSFINDLERDEKSRILLRHILSIGMDMGYSLVVEGVERQTQLNLLGDLDRLLIQGYYFYRPLSVDSAGALLELQKKR
ncbi:MAG: EAL domain-containing protein [Desulfovibrio sp.]|jgi:diguanylate cyclase (GGDEF)-like protein|nr:EAL domain-containing protein [Desulfovibrio sp.]